MTTEMHPAQRHILELLRSIGKGKPDDYDEMVEDDLIITIMAYFPYPRAMVRYHLHRLEKLGLVQAYTNGLAYPRDGEEVTTWGISESGRDALAA